MGFVGNYAPDGLSPQMDDMPVIPPKGRSPKNSVAPSSFSFLKQAVAGIRHHPALPRILHTHLAHRVTDLNHIQSVAGQGNLGAATGDTDAGHKCATCAVHAY